MALWRKSKGEIGELESEQKKTIKELDKGIKELEEIGKEIERACRHLY